MNRLILLEWGRGIAALLVVLHHATLDAPAFYHYHPFHNLFYFGMAGVDFFFVLSGFIIYYIHSEDQGTFSNIKIYLLKRVVRVYPVFLLISTALLVSYIYFGQSSQRINLLDISFLINSFLLLPSPSPPLLTVSWTLVHEMFFYLLFIIIIINKKIGLFMLFLWGIMSLFLNLNYHQLDFPINFYFNIHNIEFILGLSIAFIVKNHKLLFSVNNLKYILFFALLLFILNGMNQNYEFVKISYSMVVLIYALVSTVIIYALVSLPYKNNKSHLNKILILLGASSYSIYLIHLPVLSILHRIVMKLNLQIYIYPNFIFLLLVIVAVLVGIFTHLFIEKPMIHFFRNQFIEKNISKDTI